MRRRDIIRTRHVTQFGPVSPLPVTLVMAPSRVLMRGIVGCSISSVDRLEVTVEVPLIVQVMKMSVEMSQIDSDRARARAVSLGNGVC